MIVAVSVVLDLGPLAEDVFLLRPKNADVLDEGILLENAAFANEDTVLADKT